MKDGSLLDLLKGYAAVWGAVTGSYGAFMASLVYLRDRPRLKLDAQLAKVQGRGVQEPYLILTLEVVNLSGKVAYIDQAWVALSIPPLLQVSTPRMVERRFEFAFKSPLE